MTDLYRDEGNFASLIFRHAQDKPHRLALAIPSLWDDETVTEVNEVTYQGLVERIQRIRTGLAAEGFQSGDRVIVLMPVSIDLYAVVLALLASGLTAVLIDTGMGARRIKQSLETARAKGIISVHAFLKFRFLMWPLWKIPKKFCVDRTGLGMRPFTQLLGQPSQEAPVPRAPDDEAIITFTSGSTGRPKGADRNHGLFRAQHLALKAEYPPQEDQVDMPCFPVVAIHDLCCGISAVLPPINFAHPAGVHARPVTDYALTYGVTSLTGAPAYMAVLASHLNALGQPNHVVRQFGVGGAPVSRQVCRELKAAFPYAQGYVIYGSTEAEPIAHADIDDILRFEADGYLVGDVAESAEVALLRLPPNPVHLEERGIEPYRVPDGDIGEVVVSGPHVNRGYIDNPEANRECKLFDSTHRVWHRTGDLGYWSPQRKLVLVGRLKDVIQIDDVTIQPYPLESELEALESVNRAAVIASPKFKNGAVIVEPAVGRTLHRVLDEVCPILASTPLASVPIFWTQKIAVDGRHNSKIDRPQCRSLVDKKKYALLRR